MVQSVALTHIDGRVAKAWPPWQALWLGAVPLGTTSARQLTIRNDTPLPLAFRWEPAAADCDSSPAKHADADARCEAPGRQGGASQPEEGRSPAVLSGVLGGCPQSSREAGGRHAQGRSMAEVQQRADMQPAAGTRASDDEVGADFWIQPAVGTLPASTAVTFTASFQPHAEGSVSAFARFWLRVQPSNTYVAMPGIRGATSAEGQQASALLRSGPPESAACACEPVVAQGQGAAADRAAMRSAKSMCPSLARQCAGGADVEVTLEGLALPAPRLEAELPVLQCCARLAAGQVLAPYSRYALSGFEPQQCCAGITSVGSCAPVSTFATPTRKAYRIST